MKSLKFPNKSAPAKIYNGDGSINDNFKTSVYEIYESKICASRISTNQIANSRKFRIALFAAYSSLIAIFAIIVYTAVVLDPKFPF